MESSDDASLVAGHTDPGPPRRAARRRGAAGERRSPNRVPPDLHGDPRGPSRGAIPRGLARAGLRRGAESRHRVSMGRGKYERFPTLIAELLALEGRCDRDRRDTCHPRRQEGDDAVPLIMVAVGNPVATGIVASLTQPGGNITGLTSISEDLEGKRLELLREVLPTARASPCSGIRTIASLPDRVEGRSRAAPRCLGNGRAALEVRTPDELDETFAAIARERPEALLVIADRLFLHNRAAHHGLRYQASSARRCMRTANWSRQAG